MSPRLYVQGLRFPGTNVNADPVSALQDTPLESCEAAPSSPQHRPLLRSCQGLQPEVELGWSGPWEDWGQSSGRTVTQSSQAPWLSCWGRGGEASGEGHWGHPGDTGW